MKVTLTIRQIGTRRRARIANRVQRIATPTLLSVFHAGVLVVPAFRETFGNAHGGGVVLYLCREETAGGRLGCAGIVGEIYVALRDDRGSGVGCGFGGGG